MNAQEARAEADEKNKEADANQYSKIQKGISEEVLNGEYSYSFNDAIRPDVKKLLLSEGFKIDQGENFRDGYAVRISWGFE